MEKETRYWHNTIGDLNIYMKELTEQLSQCNNDIGMEYTRDTIHELLCDANPIAFSLDRIGIDVCELCYYMFNDKHIEFQRVWHCKKCNSEEYVEDISDPDIWQCSIPVWI